jgi:hypothetical protein
MNKTLRFIVVASLILTSAAAWAGGKKPKSKTWIDPEKARAEDPDFSIQGEYGAARADDKVPVGVQVIAMGGGKFDAYVLEGGLPGAGWDKKKKRTKMSGQTGDGEVRLEGGGFKAVIKAGKITVEKDGKEVAVLDRIDRKSPTLGAKPPAGAVVLFDGSGADNWIKGRMSEDKLLMEGTTSKPTFQSHKLHLEFRTPYKPQARGQGRGNSGLYVQGRYETQILDSFGLEGRMNETGGIYSIRHPDLNMCFPPLSWQTYDIEFATAVYKDGKKEKHAVMTVKLNGVVVQKDVECTHKTTAAPKKEGPEPGPVFLQNHGNPVRFRNIWVVEKK